MTRSPRPTAGDDMLAQLCRDLRQLRDQAGGPSVRTLSARVGLGKSQVDAILNGRVRRLPEWTVVRTMVAAFYAHAGDRGRLPYLSIRAGLDEYWRPRYAVVEHAFTRRDEVQVGVVPRQLPAVAHFVGRAAELAALERAAGRPGPLLITGMAGVGKTSLAVAWAHRAASSFHDGQMYLNLHGFDPTRAPMPPDQAVRILLGALGVPANTFPPGFEAQVGLYRSRLADRRMLIVLDDAQDASQVRPLLPGSAGCTTLVTSRVEMTDLVADGAFPVPLDVLSPAESRGLLAERLGVERVEAEPAAVDRLVAACGRLPLALTIVAARAAMRPGFPLSAIAEAAAREPGAEVWPVFSWSYRALSPPAARLFRRLALHPGTDLAVPAAAALADAAQSVVRPLLAELARANLITEPEPGRYALHDLMRAYALDMAGRVDPAPERAAALRRCFDHYVGTAYRAARVMNRQRARIPMEPIGSGARPLRFGDRTLAQGWFATEHAVLLAVTEAAAAAGYDASAWQLAWAMADHLELGGYADDWIAVQTTVVAAARRSATLLILGRMLLVLGNAYWLAGRYEDALPPVTEAIDVCRKAGEVACHARATSAMGALMERLGRFDDALTFSEQALDLFTAVRDPLGQARAHNMIGWCRSQLGDPRSALIHCRRALDLYRGRRILVGQAAAWDSLGYARHRLGQFAEAEDCYRQALAVLRDAGDRFNEAGTLDRLGEAQAAGGDPDAARDSWRQALAILDELHHPNAAAIRARLGEAEPGG